MTTLDYKPLTPYSDLDDTAFANTTLCPRYAEDDPTSAPPSPASIHAFDVLDSIPWRRSYISLDPGTEHARLRVRWKNQKLRAIVFFLLVAMLGLGCGVAAYTAVKYGKKQHKAW
ncbi:hypothetical protein BDU57DRAFT_323708 [Ampelomyces quisqualis]|uniref:Uncharacterized protein n=1 Tax=Ampelomyces quisqualis TaxID=50730 RepID=A0A6A5QG78_AMPQU|nr:hypothetical protein BDU57DRAFT_323708 [Ampelomyces quisqualis]